MAKVVCSKCGLTGLSKNPYERNVFSNTPLGYIDDIFSWITEFAPAKFLDGRVNPDQTLITFKCFIDEEDLDATGDDRVKAEARARTKRLISLRDTFKGLTDEELASLACEHTFVFQKGEVSDI